MLSAEAGNTLGDLHNSSYDTKAEFNNCFIINRPLALRGHVTNASFKQ